MFDLFRKNTDLEASPQLKTTDSCQVGLNFDPTLMHHLIEEHRDIFESLANLKQAAREKHWLKAQSALITFGTQLKAHNLTENLKLYAFLAQQSPGELKANKTVAKFRRDMIEIGRTVQRFVVAHEVSYWASEMEENFIAHSCR